MNKRQEKIRRLWERGIRDPRVIAQKLGVKGARMTSEIGRINEVIRILEDLEQGGYPPGIPSDPDE